MKKVKKIAHISDIHIRKVPTRNIEYREVFDELIKSLKNSKPNLIVIVGDLVHEYLDLQPEQLLLAHYLLNSLADIAPVRITKGNHDYRKSNLNRIDSIAAIVKTLNNPNVIYYDKTGFFKDNNIVWCVWHHGEKNNNPWKRKEGKSLIKDEELTYIDLFHDPVNGCETTSGFEMKSKSLYKLSDFKSDYSMFGDIHKMQLLNKEKTKAYCGSLISQDFSEGDDNFHGYLLWDIENKSVEEISIYNNYSFKNIIISSYTDFDDLDFEIDEPTKFMKIRFIWKTLPQIKNKENIRKLIEYIKSKYNPLSISHKNDFIEMDKIDVNENVSLENITNKVVQHEIFTEYLEKIGTDGKLINDILKLDDEIEKLLKIEDDLGSEWNIIKFGGTNFMSYSELHIDWRDKDGLFQLVGKNAEGKTTIFKLISYVLFGKTLETESRIKYGDLRYVNNRNDATSCNGYVIIETNGEYYGLKRETRITKSKDGIINGAPTIFNYYLLSSPDDEMDSNTSVENLSEDRKIITQKKIDSIIGSYDNYMRIVMTTSDTLDRILATNDMATFIDSILFDSGLDIFDKKLETFKIYQKKINEKNRIVCNVESTLEKNKVLDSDIININNEINDININVLPDLQNRIKIGNEFVETQTKKLNIIDPEIYNLDILSLEKKIKEHQDNLITINDDKVKIIENIKKLKETYNEDRLNNLIIKRDEHKTNEYNIKLKIREFEEQKQNEVHKIEILNGDLFRLKKDEQTYNTEIFNLKNSEKCPTCGQLLLRDSNTNNVQHVLEERIKNNEDKILIINAKINKIEKEDKITHSNKIKSIDDEIIILKNKIEIFSLEMVDILNEIGNLNNDKNDVEKRKEFQIKLDQIPILYQNEELKISLLEQKKNNYYSNLSNIEENKKIESIIKSAKIKLGTLINDETEKKQIIFIKNNEINEKRKQIEINNKLIKDFKEQEYQDTIMNLYKKCVHRDGIPRQLISNYILPKINLTLEKILTTTPFNIYLDPIDLRPKLVYNDRPTAIIDCISASGKERTFSSITLKFALNQINIKSKPTIFILDEIMGKLVDESINEFIEILEIVKQYMKKVLIVEHNHELNPDYLINVKTDDNGISYLSLN